MAKGKKTVAVSTLLDYANYQLARTDEFATKEFKYGICDMIEKILIESNNYNGYMFINNDDSDCDTLGHASRIYLK